MAIDLIWRTLEEFRFNRRYVNSLETQAMKDGVIRPRNPEDHRANHYKD